MNRLVDQAAAVPYRTDSGELEICLITTNSGYWGIPKGIVDPGDTPPITALKEAEEEAGLLGHLVQGSIGTYKYHKWESDLTVEVFLMQVERELDYWQEAEFREREWVDPEGAMAALADHPGIAVIAKAIQILLTRP